MPNYITVKLLRPQDMLSLELRFYNFKYGGVQLQRNAGNAYMVVVFEPQSIGEECGIETLAGKQMPDSKIRVMKSIMAANSRLVFSIPATIATIPLTINALLGWEAFTLLVNPRAKDITWSEVLIPKPPDMPGELETAIEVPFRMFLSPHAGVKWLHSKNARAFKGLSEQWNKVYELWHTRLANTSSLIEETKNWNIDKVTRAIWAVGANRNFTSKPTNIDDEDLWPSSINAYQRHHIVHESSGFGQGFKPQPVLAKKLFLSALGAWLDSDFTADTTANLPIIKWKHLQTLGRDHYVEVVNAGSIMPFGHKASLIQITERKPYQPGKMAANFKREILVITQPIKTYQYSRKQGVESIVFPFSKIEILTTTTPLLDANKTYIDSIAQALFIRVNNQDVLFQIKAEDLAGNVINFQLPLIFVPSDISKNLVSVYRAALLYNNGNFIQKNALIARKKITLAPPISGIADQPAGTEYETTELEFGASYYWNQPDELQAFLPRLNKALIYDSAYRRLTGSNDDIRVSLEDVENPKNLGKVFAKFEDQQDINFGGNSNKTGGFVMPNFNAVGLSKITGAFGGSYDDFLNTGAPTGYFKVSDIPDPTLFGAFKLSDILVLGSNVSPAALPQLTTKETSDQIITSYLLTPGLKPSPAGFATISFNIGGKSEFSVDTKIITSKAKTGAAPQFSTKTYIKNFCVDITLIKLNFKEITFTALLNAKTDVSLIMSDKNEFVNPIEFGGPLAFLNSFTDLIPLDGFSDPPYLDVSSAGIKSGYTLALPNLQLGAFTLSHLSLSAGINLPFTGAPLTAAFRFCERHQPFTLTVGIFGGGGFFGIEVDFNGIKQIEAALEFGAAAALNLGVASGAVSIMGGIYFKMTFEDGHNSTQLTGYVRINGAMTIIGLITASLEFYMALSYITSANKGGKAYGEATLKVKVEVLFFSKSVSIHTSRTFAGSGTDPRFQDMVLIEDWREYCAAFTA